MAGTVDMAADTVGMADMAAVTVACTAGGWV